MITNTKSLTNGALALLIASGTIAYAGDYSGKKHNKKEDKNVVEKVGGYLGISGDDSRNLTHEQINDATGPVRDARVTLKQLRKDLSEDTDTYEHVDKAISELNVAVEELRGLQRTAQKADYTEHKKAAEKQAKKAAHKKTKKQGLPETATRNIEEEWDASEDYLKSVSSTMEIDKDDITLQRRAEEIVVYVDLPANVSGRSADVMVDGKTMVIEGMELEEDASWISRTLATAGITGEERTHSMTLPVAVDKDTVDSEYEAGLLTVTMDVADYYDTGTQTSMN